MTALAWKSKVRQGRKINAYAATEAHEDEVATERLLI
jgi:hypothetical protein